jgi:hypothetical protein
LKNLQKVYFKFIPSLLQFIFGLNAFESLILKLKSLFENCEKKIRSSLPIRPDGLSIPAHFFYFSAPAKPQPGQGGPLRPKPAHRGESSPSVHQSDRCYSSRRAAVPYAANGYSLMLG